MSGAGSRIGPNAIIRLAEALRATDGEAAVASVFAAASLSAYLATPPREMVPAVEVTSLFGALHAAHPPRRAATVGWLAGRMTAGYLLRHRIPRAAPAVLRLVPPRIAAWLLTRAIAANAWTFVGPGRFAARPGTPWRFSITGCALCSPGTAKAPRCDFYAGTFEGLFAALVHSGARATERRCRAAGAEACEFEIAWRSG